MWDDDQIVGEFRIRHYLTDALRNGSGHIGYSVRKGCHGKGYGTIGLKLTIDEAKKIVPEEEIYLRVNKDKRWECVFNAIPTFMFPGLAVML